MFNQKHSYEFSHMISFSESRVSTFEIKTLKIVVFRVVGEIFDKI